MTARDRMPKKFAVVRLGASALGAALLFLAATVVLGVPKWSVIGKVLSGNRPDVFAGLGLVEAVAPDGFAFDEFGAQRGAFPLDALRQEGIAIAEPGDGPQQGALAGG